MVIQFFLRSFLSILKSGMIIYDAQRERNTRVFIALFDSFFSLEKSCIFPTKTNLRARLVSIAIKETEEDIYIYILVAHRQKRRRLCFFLAR